MVRSLPSALTTALAADTITDLIALIEIATPTPTYRALWPKDITFDGNTYTADAGAFSEVRQGIEGERPRFRLSLQNVTDYKTDAALPWTTTLGTTDLNGTEVKIRVVKESLLADTTAVILEEKWYISGASLDRQFVRFDLGSPHDALAFTVPRISVGAKTCFWRYQAGACTNRAADNGKPDCPKTVAACLARTPAGAALPIGPSFGFMAKPSRNRR